MREKVLAMKPIWAEDDAEFHGEFVDFARILTGLRPTASAPTQTGGYPRARSPTSPRHEPPRPPPPSLGINGA